MVSDDILCPECGAKMHKTGWVWSGRRRVQRYRCPKCGRTHMLPPADHDEREVYDGKQ